jgi:hypothetical protein
MSKRDFPAPRAIRANLADSHLEFERARRGAMQSINALMYKALWIARTPCAMNSGEDELSTPFRWKRESPEQTTFGTPLMAYFSSTYGKKWFAHHMSKPLSMSKPLWRPTWCWARSVLFGIRFLGKRGALGPFAKNRSRRPVPLRSVTMRRKNCSVCVVGMDAGPGSD